MGSEMEKMLKRLDLENKSEEEANAALEEFFRNNSGMGMEMTEEMAVTSDDFMELAEEARNEASALKYAKKALQLDPDNLDAECMIANITARNPIDQLKKLKEIVAHGERVMQEQGYAGEDCIGRYWGILGTRSYMRVRMEYMTELRDNGMIGRAISEGEEMLRLNENDNLGVRYLLMHLFAWMEDEKKALALHKKYNSYEETQMLLPLSMLYFKLGKEEEAADYLRRAAAVNKDMKKFARAIVNDKLEQYADGMSPYGYRPFTMDELLVEMMENQDVFDSVPGYFYWANEQLKSKRK